MGQTCMRQILITDLPKCNTENTLYSYRNERTYHPNSIKLRRVAIGNFSGQRGLMPAGILLSIKAFVKCAKTCNNQ
jgi:hypothetical protein